MKRGWLLAVFLSCCLWAEGAQAAVGDSQPQDTTKWYNRTHAVREVTVSSHRRRYSRKGNPAVELMRKVIAAKGRTDTEKMPYCRYRKYQKLTFAANDMTPEALASGLFGKVPGLATLVEACPETGKLVLPLNYTETVTDHLHRLSPHADRDITVGERSEGLSEMFATGGILNAAMKDFFTDVDIYDNQVRLLQHPFTSPISPDAIGFYRFFITDTLAVGADSCTQLYFSPNNPQDFGFSGYIYILNDSTYQVRRCELSLPRGTGVNFVDGLSITQEFERLRTGERVLTTDDMTLELSVADFMAKAVIMRHTRLSQYRFTPFADEELSMRRKAHTEQEARGRDDAFWHANRLTRLTASEHNLGRYIDRLAQSRAYQWVMAGMKVLVENFVETGGKRTPSKVDIGPINTLISKNDVDGLRTRLSAQTTANLSPHLFLSGYYAHGWRSRRDYYNAELTYSPGRKRYLPDEFPMRYVRVASTYDVCSPTDKFLTTDKDNVFTAFKWSRVDLMMFYRRQTLSLVREEHFGLRTTLALKVEEDEATQQLHFTNLRTGGESKLRTTELSLQLRYAPGEKVVNTKQRRRPINRDVPVLTLTHTAGVKGLLGGQYDSHLTELTLFRRFWLRSWGKLDLDAKAAAQWGRVPFPLLLTPDANLSYITQYSTFELVNNMEFVADRYAHLMLTWDLSGKLLNRVPLLRRLKWREVLGARAAWGTLTRKNDPTLAANADDGRLMALPASSTPMDPARPYVEVVAGVANVCRFFQVEYVRRLTHLSLPTTTKQGVRVKFQLRF